MYAELFQIVRRELGLSYQQVADLSGVSLPTVQRILTGKSPHADIANVVRIAEVLGIEIEYKRRASAHELRSKQAEAKARKIVSLVQGTSALEGQAVGKKDLDEMIQQTAAELLAGSPRHLWSDV